MITIDRQCSLVSLARSSYYYQSERDDRYNLLIMKLIDEQFTKAPFYGVPRMTGWVIRQGYPVNRKRIRRLMRLMDLEAIYPKPRLSKAGPEHTVYPLVSALVTGGLGPWLPYETFALGWVGASAGLAGSAVRRLRPGRRVWSPGRLDMAVLVGVAIVTGFAYGALTDIWGWVAFYRGVDNIGWAPGLSAADTLARFGRYYALTSLAWDAFRAVGDALAVLALGAPVLMALGRLRARLGYEIVASIDR